MTRIALAAVVLISFAGCATSSREPRNGDIYQIGESKIAAGDEERAYAETADKTSLAQSGQSLRFIRSPLPAMPRQAVREGIEGTVIVSILFGEPGAVETVTLISSPHELLSLAVLTTVRDWKIEPHLSNGKPSKITIRQRFSFVAK